MSFVILATRKTHPAVVVTRRTSLRAAHYIAKELKALSKPHEGINYKILESGCLYCSMCGKAEDWDNPTTCHKPKNPQDWTCGFADIVKGVNSQMIYTIDEKPGVGMILSPLKDWTVKAYFKQHVITGALNKNALAMRPESSNADFCLTCLCIYDTDGGCMCTRYARNSAGDYIAKQEAI